MLFDEIQRRTDAHKVDGVLGMHPQTLYEMAEKLAPDEAMRLLQASETEDERKFYAYIVNMNLQRKQKEVIEKKLF